MVSTIIFDLGGVYFEDGTKKFLYILSGRIGRSTEELYPIFREGKSLDYRANKISGNNFFKWASDTLENKISPEELNLLWVSQYTEIAGTKNIILDLKQKGYKTAIISDNVPERVKYLNDKYRFLSLFDFNFLSYQVNLTKNSKEIFIHALNTMNIAPSDAIFVDDRQEIIEVAKSVGLITILFQNPENLSQELDRLLRRAAPRNDSKKNYK